MPLSWRGVREEVCAHASISRPADAMAVKTRNTGGCYTTRLNLSNTPALDSIARETRALKASGKKLVFTNGCFDILHPGHVDLLRRARSLGDALVVAINSDESVRRIKGPNRPIFSESERAEVLRAFEMVDFVCIFSEDTPLQTILALQPDVLVKGADWVDNIVGSREVESWGGRVAALPLVAGQSTTGIVERVLSRYGDPGKAHQ